MVNQETVQTNDIKQRKTKLKEETKNPKKSKGKRKQKRATIGCNKSNNIVKEQS